MCYVGTPFNRRAVAVSVRQMNVGCEIIFIFSSYYTSQRVKLNYQIITLKY